MMACQESIVMAISRMLLAEFESTYKALIMMASVEYKRMAYEDNIGKAAINGIAKKERLTRQLWEEQRLAFECLMIDCTATLPSEQTFIMVRTIITLVTSKGNTVLSDNAITNPIPYDKGMPLLESSKMPELPVSYVNAPVTPPMAVRECVLKEHGASQEHDASLLRDSSPIKALQLSQDDDIPQLMSVKRKPPPKRKIVPANVRMEVWRRWIGIDKGVALCPMCEIEKITQGDSGCWHVAHVVPHSAEGGYNLSNLRPICKSCNFSSSSMNLRDYCKRYFPKSVDRLQLH